MHATTRDTEPRGPPRDQTPTGRCLTTLSESALSSAVLVLGAPRSGTTWLAKIIDSHPDVLYRHEPDAMIPGAETPAAPDILPLLRLWAQARSAKTSSKRPFFRKRWQPAGAAVLRAVVAGGVSLAARLPAPFRSLARVPIPDIAIAQPRRLVIKSIAWTAGAPVLAAALPASRTVLILRHPCGQVDSVMRGNRQRRFDLKTAGTDMPFNEIAAIRHAAAFGITEPGFQALPDAAKYAWSWRAFNEPLYAALADRPNARVLVYETLCEQPVQLARQILSFCGLDWDRQTADFIGRSSTRAGKSGYYSINRDAIAAADRWRSSMPQADADAVRAVVADSPLASLWPDIARIDKGVTISH